MRHTIKPIIMGCSLLLTPAFAADIQTRIIGGCESAPVGHPWMVTLARKTGTNELQSQFCGATLINAQWAVTAAHCMFYNDANGDEQIMNNNQIELYIGTRVLDSGQGQHHDVSRIITHPEYSSLTLQHDIALLKLSTPTAQAVARLASLKPGAGHTALTAGWGRLNAISSDFEPDQWPRSLREVNVSTFDNAQCDSDLLNSQMCAGFMQGGKDSCSGDSGGPLVLNSQGQDTLVGIVSYGYGCAQPGFPGVYTSVAAYRNWIAESTLDATTGLSAVPAPAAISENYSDFDSACGMTDGGTGGEVPPATGDGTGGEVPPATEDGNPISSTDVINSLIGTGGGGSTGPLFLLISLLGLARRRIQATKGT